jgi:NAD(P)-dependent dehydrogenase (short-subunit alcohol dehydrogenase family)
MKMKLKNKVTVITGGNSGIAEAFKNEGAIGVITGRNQQTLERSLAQLGDGFNAIPGDVTKMEDLKRIFKETFEKFGKIDVVVVNAGGFPDHGELGPVTDIGEDVFDKFMALNLKSYYFKVQHAVPYMNDGGSIILMSSYGAHYAFPGMSIYSAAKAAAISFARGFSQDLLSRNIRVNVLSPGTIDTPIFDKFISEEDLADFKEQLVKDIPAGRIGLPSDIGYAAVFMASQESSFIVGTEIISDGGVLNLSPKKQAG